jgi:hypothetical protein
MPNRIIREGILTSERINRLSPKAELFYRRLMSVADDYGRFHSNPVLLRSACYPLQIDTVHDKDITEWLTECVENLAVVVYEAQGKRCLELMNFRQQQRAKDSKFPAMDEQVRSKWTADAKQPLSNAHLDEGVCEDEGVCDRVGSLKSFGELQKVRLTPDEYAKLVAKHGEQRTKAAIEVLDGYIASKNKRYANHYAVMKEGSWVWERVAASVPRRENQI